MSRLILPGWQGSGPGHWQRCWAAEDDRCRVVEQDDWERPELGAWLDRLHAAVMNSPGSILIAHSLGAVLVAHYARRHPDAPVAGALLVAPADVDALSSDHALASFQPAPLSPLPFPSLLALSRNDPYISVARGQLFARAWGSELVDLGEAGHVNTESGHGPWRQGFTLADHLEQHLVRAAA